MTDTPEAPEVAQRTPAHLGQLILAWLFALAASLSVVLWAPPEYRFEWLAVAIGGTLLVSFVLQLGTAQREGFITRLSYSVVGGAFIIGLVECVTFFVTGR